MTSLEEIAADLIDETTNLANTLRKAQILADQLGSPELSDWVKSELDGYRGDGVPEYRLLHLPVYGEFPVPMQGRTETIDISSHLPQQLRDTVQELAIADQIAVLEARLASGETESHREITKEFTDILRQAVKMSNGAELRSAHQRLPHVFLAGVLDSVKNRLLDFILDLQKMNATPEALNDGSVATEAIRNSFITNIYGDDNTVAIGENVSQTVTTVHKGNVESLIEYLRAHNINEEDLSELSSAVASEPQSRGTGFGPKVAGWIGNMVGKALSGAWQYPGDKAQLMLMEAMNGFYRA